MSENKGLTSDQLAIISNGLSIIAYGIGLLAIEKSSSDKKKEAEVSAALSRILKRFS
ncbi:hypothetical protein [Paenibacillus mendelii]|uniref:Uncharacterized protein n=1 Tax=Paenibacillus mendelii TaxID=206163 RepID=A0ABV6J6U7_9BACL|nr:hypothetical protein [Paenibacillus mendelii]MCQ6561128.1 hypothetical protein [Paenibacillus mendelii]